MFAHDGRRHLTFEEWITLRSDEMEFLGDVERERRITLHADKIIDLRPYLAERHRRMIA